MRRATRDEVMAPAARPSDDCIVLAMALDAREWTYAMEIARVLGLLGWEVKPSQLGATLRRLAAEDNPMVECKREEWASAHASLRYRVTRFGHCQLGNHFDGYYAVSHEARVVAAELARERRARA